MGVCILGVFFVHARRDVHKKARRDTKAPYPALLWPCAGSSVVCRSVYYSTLIMRRRGLLVLRRSLSTNPNPFPTPNPKHPLPRSPRSPRTTLGHVTPIRSDVPSRIVRPSYEKKNIGVQPEHVPHDSKGVECMREASRQTSNALDYAESLLRVGMCKGT